MGKEGCLKAGRVRAFVLFRIGIGDRMNIVSSITRPKQTRRPSRSALGVAFVRKKHASGKANQISQPAMERPFADGKIGS